MSTATLTSLAMLKVKVDQGGDYLDYLKPFILQILVDRRTEDIIEKTVKKQILQQFGLDIPDRSIQIVLRRLCRSHSLKRGQGIYRIEKEIQDPGISGNRNEAIRHISDLTLGLIEFSRTSARPILSEEDAQTAILRFLSKFDVICLRAYLKGNAIPDLEDDRGTDIVLVSKYVMHLQKTSPERFKSLSIMVQGHMLANALLCPDLIDAPRSFERVTFFLDTPLCLKLLRLHGKAEYDDTTELVTLLKRLNGKIAIFEHTHKETSYVIEKAIENINNPKGYGRVVLEARRRKLGKSDLILLAKKSDDWHEDFSIEIRESPAYNENQKFQINESRFEDMLKNKITYSNPNAIKFDINSVRSIYALRKSSRISSIENSIAIMVTDNTAFSKMAWEYEKIHNPLSSRVSSVVTDFTLANIAWLKAPMGAPELPKTEILAFAYAALRPSKELLGRFMAEMDKLDQEGRITPEDHQLLRSNFQVPDELMEATLGDESKLTEEHIQEALERIKAELKKEESEKTKEVENLYGETKRELDDYIKREAEIKKKIYWISQRRANKFTKIIKISIFFLLLPGFLVGLGDTLNNAIVKCLLSVGSILVAIAMAADLVWGTTIESICSRINKHFLNSFFRREANRIGINLDDSP